MHEMDGNNLLEMLSREMEMNLEVQSEELINWMVDLSQHRSFLNSMYDYKGLQLLEAARTYVGEYIIVSGALKIQKKLFNPTWFSMKTFMVESSYLFFERELDDTLEEYSFSYVNIEEFLKLIILELATADHASRLGQPWIIIKQLSDAPYHCIIPSSHGLNRFKSTITDLLNETISITNWISRIKKEFISKAKGRS